MTLITGVAYPLLITGLAQVLFPHEANGSMVLVDGKPIGSALVGQKFIADKYFWPRPSGVDYNPMPSSGTNLGPTSAALREAVLDRKMALVNERSSGEPPADLIFASGSGLDPHISPDAARFQVDRVATARQLDETQRQSLLTILTSHIELPALGLIGEQRINVLHLNLAIDSAFNVIQ